MKSPIYLDHHATTPTSRVVWETMAPFFCDVYGNVGSRHCFGRPVREACELARQQVADLMGCEPTEIIFTSGATESDNLAIKGVAQAFQNIGRHIITSSIEHKAVLDSCRFLESSGFEVSYLDPKPDGHIDLEELEATIRKGEVGSVNRTTLITIMGANNEIGVVNPVKEIGEIAQKNKIIFHCDGAQTVGKIPFDLNNLAVDLVSMSGHKIYGPKGVGALFFSRKNSDLNIVPMFHGGGQEFGIRSGTLPVPLIVGLGKACELAKSKMAAENKRLLNLRTEFLQLLKERVGHIKVNGDLDERLPGNLNICFDGIDSEFLALAFKDIAVSQTSACSAGQLKPSYVLKAIGLNDDQAMCSVRFGLGSSNTRDEINYVVDKIIDVYKKFGDKKPKASLKSDSQQKLTS